LSDKINSYLNQQYDMGMMPYGYDYYNPQPMYPSQPMYPAFPMLPAEPQPMEPVQPTLPVPGKPGIDVPGLLPSEQSYVENILRLNLGKVGTFYMTYEGNQEWNAKIFKGKVEAAGRDHIIISDPATGKRYMLLMVNLDYVTFDEPLRYIPEQREL